MSNILIHMTVQKNSEYDIFSSTDYAQMSETFRQNGIQCPNLGNRLWFQGLISEISTPENQLTYFSEDMSKEYINETFDMVIAPMANVFHVNFSELLERLANRFTGIRIPVYVIACGVQADSYDDLDGLAKSISGPASAFIKSVYNTGGEFALRGYFTKSFFEKLGFPSAVVTGCPSLYQLGRNLHIPEDKVSEKEFRPLLNGELVYISLMKRYPNTEFFDQERFFHILHDAEYDLDIHSLLRSLGLKTTECVLNGRVRLIPNMNDWRNYLIQSGFNFSFGSRIHGSIMPLLSGVPAVIDARDARTKEMAEFFDIPIYDKKSQIHNVSLYDLYVNTDFSVFNKKFAEKFDAYENFLIERKVVDKINTSNSFFDTTSVGVFANGNDERLDALRSSFLRRKYFWKCYEKLLKMKYSFASERKK